MKQLAYGFAVLLLLLCIAQTVLGSAAGQFDRKETELFLTAHISNSKPFVGEAFELTYTLFFKGIAPQILDTGQPVHEGMWAEETVPQKLMTSKPEPVDDIVYRSAVIKRMTLVPLQSGRLSVTGYRVLCITPTSLSIAASWKQDDSLSLAAPRVTVEAIPLPEPKPAGFGGAVGTFTAYASADRDTVKKGETLQLTTSISGKGNVQTLPVIPLSLPEGLTPIETTTLPVVDSSAGELRKTIALKAEKPGTFIFSPISFIAFDPEKAAYTTVRPSPDTLTVLPSPGVASEKKLPVKPSIPDTVRRIPAGNTSSGTLFIPALALSLALAAALLYLYRKKRLKNHDREEPPLSLQNLRERLSLAVESGYAVRPETVTRSELKRILREKGVCEDMIKKAVHLLDELDRIEFTPGEPEKGEFEILCRESREVTSALLSRDYGTEKTS